MRNPGPIGSVRRNTLDGCTNKVEGLTCLFLFLFDERIILQLITNNESNQYAFQDWVTEAGEATYPTNGWVRKKTKMFKRCDVTSPNKQNQDRSSEGDTVLGTDRSILLPRSYAGSGPHSAFSFSSQGFSSQG